MKAHLSVLAMLLLLPAVLVGSEAVSFTVTKTTTVKDRRSVTVEVRLPSTISITKDAYMAVMVGVTEVGGPADQFGPPQIFALKGTRAEIGQNLFRIQVALPTKKVGVRFSLREREDNKVLFEETREI